jgi:hypothetical protein
LTLRALSQRQPAFLTPPPSSNVGQQLVATVWQKVDEPSLAAFQLGGWLTGSDIALIRDAGRALSFLSLTRALGKANELLNHYFG